MFQSSSDRGDVRSVKTVSAVLPGSFPAEVPVRALLTAGFLVLCLASSIHTVDIRVWLLENVLVLIAVAWVALTWRTLPLSNFSYLLLYLFLLIHEVGAHYTYEKVPIGFWLKAPTGFVRNDFDRIVHFSFGFFLALPCYESLRQFISRSRLLLWTAPIIVLTAFSAFYEIAEAYANLILAPYTAAAYLSLQGDPFDSQNDMASAVIGAILAMLVIAAVKRRTHPAWMA